MTHFHSHSDSDAGNPAPSGPIIRSRAEHSISRRNIDRDALQVLYRLHHCGYKGYLVGGGVRDLLLGRQPKDFDVGTDAHPQEIKRMFRNCFLIGRRFRLAHIRYGQKVIETSTFRREPDPATAEAVAHGSLLQHHDNTFGTPEEDARRRDFTINGIFYDIATFSVIDHVGGLADLERRVVRCIGDPDIRFREDPVRMIRAVRFASRLGFTIEHGTFEAIVRHHLELAKAAPPRLLEEIYRLFGFQAGQAAFRLLHQTRLLAALFPELDDILNREDERAARVWACLAAQDADEAARGHLSEAIAFACVFWEPFLLAAERAREDDNYGAALDAAHLLLQPYARALCMPKWLYYRVARMLAGQGRMDHPRLSGAARRFVDQEGFEDTMALYRICRHAQQQDDGPLTFWRGLYEEQRQHRGRLRPRGGRRHPRGGGVDHHAPMRSDSGSQAR